MHSTQYILLLASSKKKEFIPCITFDKQKKTIIYISFYIMITTNLVYPYDTVNKRSTIRLVIYLNSLKY